MRKSTLYISAALTTFMLAVLLGIAATYQSIVRTKSTTGNATMVATTNSIAGGTMSMEQAASLASNVIGRTDMYTAEISQLNGVDVYLVTFSSGDLVYVSKDGQILSISKLPVTVVIAPNNGGGNHHNGNGDSNPVIAPTTLPVPRPAGGNNGGGGGDD